MISAETMARYWKAVDEQGVTIDVLTWLETEPAEKEWDALALRLGLDIDKWKHGRRRWQGQR